MKIVNCVLGLALCASVVGAGEAIPFDSPRWRIEAADPRIEEYQGKNEIVLAVSESFGG